MSAEYRLGQAVVTFDIKKKISALSRPFLKTLTREAQTQPQINPARRCNQSQDSEECFSLLQTPCFISPLIWKHRTRIFYSAINPLAASCTKHFHISLFCSNSFQSTSLVPRLLLTHGRTRLCKRSQWLSSETVAAKKRAWTFLVSLCLSGKAIVTQA